MEVGDRVYVFCVDLNGNWFNTEPKCEEPYTKVFGEITMLTGHNFEIFGKHISSSVANIKLETGEVLEGFPTSHVFPEETSVTPVVAITYLVANKLAPELSLEYIRGEINKFSGIPYFEIENLLSSYYITVNSKVPEDEVKRLLDIATYVINYHNRR